MEVYVVYSLLYSPSHEDRANICPNLKTDNNFWEFQYNDPPANRMSS